jgi:hypothetical protein
MMPRKSQLPAFTAAGYIDAMEAAGYELHAAGVDPEKRSWIYTGLARVNCSGGRAYRRTEKWQRALLYAGKKGKRAVVRELVRRGQWLRFNAWPVDSPLERRVAAAQRAEA